MVGVTVGIWGYTMCFQIRWHDPTKHLRG
jgi:hypothetical protein